MNLNYGAIADWENLSIKGHVVQPKSGRSNLFYNIQVALPLLTASLTRELIAEQDSKFHC